MSDPLRTDPARAADALSGLERDARIEQLLLQGLDAYFAGAYESAIHVWTRVLFLDRGHDRARAYIERARSAQAERQRESEELLHRGVAAFDRGETTSARSLLSAAASQGASPEVALSYLERLERLDAPARAASALAGPGDALHSAPRLPVPARDGAPRPWRFYGLAALSVIAVSIAAWAGLVLFELADIRAALQRAPAATPIAPAAVEEAVPVPRPTEITLARARAQYRAGHVVEALRLLDTIRPFDPAEGEADRLRAEIQQALGLVPASPAPASAPRGAPAGASLP
jgi:tetratricopeptide (TPR) repeat protein